ncbi:uncharacterized protein OCT59_019515 [Rhizophagus irregularis]|uniref:uncharacterized protein n=1 Tax=Rhizophagus irregularis TaxID=588596 RepID=UPI000CC66E17|nr:hypothetical protein OCT59_019515 [Rhizophagus irregularis]GBC51523.1 hypothetical protein RIR_jg26185.t1 [Rhizophagus irregularis DAOM 181602=DAOM 197198]
MSLVRKVEKKKKRRKTRSFIKLCSDDVRGFKRAKKHQNEKKEKDNLEKKRKEIERKIQAKNFFAVHVDKKLIELKTRQDIESQQIQFDYLEIQTWCMAVCIVIVRIANVDRFVEALTDIVQYVVIIDAVNETLVT